MTVEDDEIAAQINDRKPRRNSGGAIMRMQDGRLSSLIRWVWATLGGLALLVGVGVYTKLADLNDTLIRAVVQIENQGNEIKEIKGQLTDQQRDIDSLRAQMYSLEGKTLRGIQEMKRAN